MTEFAPTPRDANGDRIFVNPELEVLRTKVQEALDRVEKGHPPPWVEFDPWAQLNPHPDTQEAALIWVLGAIEEVLV